MKTTHKFLALALMAVATAFTSCSSDNEPGTPNQTFQPGQIVSNEAIAAQGEMSFSRI